MTKAQTTRERNDAYAHAAEIAEEYADRYSAETLGKHQSALDEVREDICRYVAQDIREYIKEVTK